MVLRSVVLVPLFAVLVATLARPQDPQPAPPSGNARSLEERRAIAQDAARFEVKYRNTLARIQRLIEVYKAKGDEEHVIQLERLREKLAVRREHAMEGFRKELGESGFQRVQAQLAGEGRRSLEDRAKKSKPPGESGGGN